MKCSTKSSSCSWNSGPTTNWPISRTSSPRAGPATRRTTSTRRPTRSARCWTWTRGRRQGKAFPFGSFTLGATRYATSIQGADDSWRFSVAPGLGVKFYPGGRLSLRLHARLPLTLTEGGYGFACGGGGCYTSVGGSGNTQFDVGGGLGILF